MIVPSQLALKIHTSFGCAASLAPLNKLVDRFPLPPVAPSIGDTSFIYDACGTFNYVTKAYYKGTIIYNDPGALKINSLLIKEMWLSRS
jgi:hypothetical protein